MIDVTVWGPALWRAIHLVALGYPDLPTAAQRDAYERFFTALGEVLPCRKCRDNYARHLGEAPIELANRDALFAWTVQLHNTVNAENGKPQMSVADAWAAATSAPPTAAAPTPTALAPTSTALTPTSTAATVLAGVLLAGLVGVLLAALVGLVRRRGGSGRARR